MTPAQLDLVRDLYRTGLDIYEIARTVGVPWPRVHEAIFNMKRSGELPRRSA